MQACAEGNMEELEAAFAAGGSVNATNGVSLPRQATFVASAAHVLGWATTCGLSCSFAI